MAFAHKRAAEHGDGSSYERVQQTPQQMLLQDLEGEVDRLKNKLNDVITAAEETLQTAYDSQEEIKMTYDNQYQQLLEENKHLANENATCRRTIGTLKGDLDKEKKAFSKALRHVERLTSRKPLLNPKGGGAGGSSSSEKDSSSAAPYSLLDENDSREVISKLRSDLITSRAETASAMMLLHECNKVSSLSVELTSHEVFLKHILKKVDISDPADLTGAKADFQTFWAMVSDSPLDRVLQEFGTNLSTFKVDAENKLSGVVALVKEYQHVQEALDRGLQEKTEFEEKIAQAAAVIQNLCGKLEASMATCTGLQEKIDITLKQFAAKDEDIAYFESKYESLKNDFLRYKSNYGAANDRANMSAAERDRLLAQLEQCNDRLLEAQARIATVEKDRTAIEILLTSNESNKVVLEGQLSDALKDIADLKEYSKRLNDENCNLLYLKSKEHIVNSSLQVAIQKQAEYENTVKQLMKQLETSQKRLAEASSESQNMLDKFMVTVELEKQQILGECNRDWESKFASKTGYFESLLQQAGSSSGAQSQLYRSQVDALEADVMFLRTELSKECKESASLRSDLHMLHASRDASQRGQHDEAAALRKELAAAKQRGDRAEARLHHVELQKAKEVEEKNRQMAEIGDRGRQLSLELGDEVRKNQAKEAKFKQRIAELSDKVEAMSSGALAAADQVPSSQQSLQQSLQQRIEELSQELTEERSKKAATQEALAALAREHDSKKLEEEDFRSLSEALQRVHEHDRDAFAEELTKKLGMMMVHKYELLEASMGATQKEADRLQAANRLLERELESQRAVRVSPEEVAAKDSEMRIYQGKIDALEASLAKAEQASADSSSKQSSLETKFSVQARLFEELKTSSSAKVAQETQALLSKNAELQSRHDKYRFETENQLRKMEQQVETLDAELVRLGAAAAPAAKGASREDALIAEKVLLEKAAAAAERELEACRASLLASEDSGRTLSAKASQAGELREELQALRRRCGTCEEERDAARQQLQELGEEMMREALATSQRKNDIQQLSSELESLKSIYKPLLAEFETMSNELQAKKIALDTESNFRQVAERNLERLKSNLAPISGTASASTQSAELAAARKELDEALERVNSLEETTVLLEQTCHDREERYNDALKKQMELEVELSQSNGLICSARDHIHHLEDLLKRASTHISAQVAASEKIKVDARNASRPGDAAPAPSSEASSADSAAGILSFDEMFASTLSGITQAVGMMLPLDVLGRDRTYMTSLSEEFREEPADLPAALLQLSKLKRSYATLLDVSSALKSDARTAEDEYKSAAKQLIETVETQRMNLIKEIEDQRRRLQVSKNKISLYKTMIRSQKAKIEHLARRFNLDISDPDVRAGSVISGVTDMTDADDFYERER